MRRESHFYDELSGEINRGEHDDHLDFLEFSIKSRRNALVVEATDELVHVLKENSLVKIRMDAPLGPKYLLGTLLEVEKVNRTTASCKVANPELLPSQRFARGVRVPLEHLELVTA